MKKALYVFCRVLLYIPIILAGLVAGLIAIVAGLFVGLMVQR